MYLQEKILMIRSYLNKKETELDQWKKIKCKDKFWRINLLQNLQKSFSMLFSSKKVNFQEYLQWEQPNGLIKPLTDRVLVSNKRVHFPILFTRKWLVVTNINPHIPYLHQIYRLLRILINFYSSNNRTMKRSSNYISNKIKPSHQWKVKQL